MLSIIESISPDNNPHGTDADKNKYCIFSAKFLDSG